MEKNQSISILYVEDQSDVRLFLSKILSRHYSKVYLAENGKLGLELYKKHAPDIVISDIKMPVMDGLSMSSKIKEINPKAKIILTTAHSDMEYFIHSIDIGISQYILKPLDRDKLYHAINTCVDQVIMERDIEKKNNDLIASNKKLLLQERELRESLQKTIALKEIISKSEENFRQLAENIQDAFWLCTGKKILYVNNTFQEIFEIPVSEIYDNACNLIDFVHPDDKSRFGEILIKHENKLEGSLQEEVRIITPKNNQKSILYRDVYIDSPGADQPRRVIAATDITRQKENEKLQQDLQIAEKSARIKQQLLANISHEMRTPMNGIMAMADILAQTQLQPQQQDYTQTIKSSAEALLEMINDLLDITEMEDENVSVKMQKFNPRNVFQDIINRFSNPAAQKDLYLTTSFDKGFPNLLKSDKKRVKQVLKSLLSNAVKFTSKGGIEVKFKHHKLNDKKWEITIEVIDTGIGIEEADQAKMFDVFTQKHDSDSRTFEGLGLGLTLCSKVADLLQGQIQMESSPQKGSKFIFSFPSEIVEEQIIALPHAETPISKQLNINAKVLYAEDKKVNQKVISIILENVGCTVDIAENGLQALEMYEQQSYDLILMDIQMPLMDGITAMKELRKKHNNLPPIIGLSANALQQDADKYIEQGLDDYIAKPVIPANLYSKMIEWLKIKSQNNVVVDTDKPTQATGEQTKKQSTIADLDADTYKTIEEQTRGDRAIISDLYNSFIEETEAILKEVEAAIEAKDTKQIASSIHALKGLSVTVGALGVYDISLKMDALHKQGKFEEAIPMFSILKEKFIISKKLIIKKILN